MVGEPQGAIVMDAGAGHADRDRCRRPALPPARAAPRRHGGRRRRAADSRARLARRHRRADELIPEINEAFGLSAAQVERLAPDRSSSSTRRFRPAAASSSARSSRGRWCCACCGTWAFRLSTQQAAKFVPCGRPGGIGGVDILGVAVRVRAAHPAVRGRVAAIGARSAAGSLAAGEINESGTETAMAVPQSDLAIATGRRDR